MRLLEKWHYAPDRVFGASAGASAKTKNAAIERGLLYHRAVYKRLALQAKISFEGWELYIEPWFRTYGDNWKQRSPDSLLLNKTTGEGIVIEVKMNWKDGRDQKLLFEYLPIVRSAFDLSRTVPLLITANLRGYEHPPLLGLKDCLKPLSWSPGQPTPLMLVPR